MRSDRAIVQANLVKVKCSLCGLVSSLEKQDQTKSLQFYKEKYFQRHCDEHYFYLDKKKISRSQVFYDWILKSFGAEIWQGKTSALEVGVGAGHLLKKMSERLPHITFQGIELSKNSSEYAQSLGLNVFNRSIEELDSSRYELIYSIAVIEHVESPGKFLCELNKKLKNGGYLILSQPCQDIVSYDVFFYDHLYHFSSDHIKEYAHKCGFELLKQELGNAVMPNFSLHLLKKVAEVKDLSHTNVCFSETKCEESVAKFSADFNRLNKILRALEARGEEIAVFGLNEVFWLFWAYSDLRDVPIAYGLDDNPHKKEYEALDFPVISPNGIEAKCIKNIVLTMNSFYYLLIEKRFEGRNFRLYPTISN